MLDQTTKKRIKDLRGTLVGKIPDPKGQVEQIMIAMMYKFMDDMDTESLELGGKRSFFIGQYNKFSWENLFESKVTGEELVKLYFNAIESMENNPNIPQLFRDIFKNAFIPYKDPQVLRIFLNQINEFQYSHDSEQLGDAFEYLLSSLNSQGEAGQMRTPRHIIDFIVESVNPTKKDTILDPSSGTSGFLISAYKKILKDISDGKEGSGVSETDRKKIMSNINGYDISPDYLKIGLTNMYLHGFENPKVYEYDTLSSDEKWEEYFDIILANPPFFTPKQGIRPHNRFSVKSKRAEVLFVDYIISHLKPKGKAGIIIPDSILFKKDKAYQTLRKKLLDNGLIGIVSLPAGVFEPYAGQKTSILFIDKTMAASDVFYLEINNDGYSLNKKRIPIEKNDIPDVLKKIKNKSHKHDIQIKKSLILNDEKISLNLKDYIDTDNVKSQYKSVNILELINIIPPVKKIKKTDYKLEGKYPVVDQSEKYIAGYSNEDSYLTKVPSSVIVFGDHTRCFKYINFDFVAGADGIKILEPKENILPKYLYYILKNSEIENLGYSRHFKLLKKINIPLPPLDKQLEIVDKIEQFQKVIDGAEQVIQNFSPIIEIEDTTNLVEIGEICSLMTGGTPSKNEKKYYEPGEIKWLVSGDIHAVEIYDCEGRISKLGLENSNAKFLPENSVLMALNGQGKTRGSVAILRTQATCNQSLVSIIPNKSNEILTEYLYLCLKNKYKEIREITGDKERSGLNMPTIKKIKIPLVNIDSQRSIVEKAFSEINLVNNLKLVINNNKIQINKVIKSIN